MTDSYRGHSGGRKHDYAVLATSDDRLALAADLWKLRAAGGRLVDLAEVRLLNPPPRTASRFALIRWKR